MSSPSVPQSTRNWKITAALAGLGVLLVALASVLTISENPPGLVAAFGAMLAFAAALVHPWRRTRSFVRLAGWSLLGFLVTAILHNFPDVLGERNPGTLFGNVMGGIGATLFLIAIFVAPALFTAGVIGAVATWLRDAFRGTASPASR